MQNGERATTSQQCPSNETNEDLQHRRKQRTITCLRNHFPTLRGKAGEAGCTATRGQSWGQNKPPFFFWHVSVSVFDLPDFTPLVVGNGLHKIQADFCSK
jgi:hypothetical protein